MKLLGRTPKAGDSGSVQLVAEESECCVLDESPLHADCTWSRV